MKPETIWAHGSCWALFIHNHMKTLIIILSVLPIAAYAHDINAFRRFNAACASVETSIHRNQWNYKLQLLYQPEYVRIEPELHVEQSLEAVASFKIIISSGLWYGPIQDLFHRFEQMHPRDAEDAIYYDCGVEFIAPWNQKSVTIYFNKKKKIMKLNGNCFRTEMALEEWWNHIVKPVFGVLESSSGTK